MTDSVIVIDKLKTPELQFIAVVKRQKNHLLRLTSSAEFTTAVVCISKLLEIFITVY